MGGFGSGRRAGGGRELIEETRNLSIGWVREKWHELQQTGLILSWRRGEEPFGSMQVLRRERLLLLGYQYREGQIGEWCSQRVAVTLQPQSCRFGGARWWFLCPRCYRRVGTVFITQRVGCRHCLHLAYREENEGSVGRLEGKANKIKKKLEPTNWKRPPGMPHSTHARLLQTYDSVTRQLEELRIQQLRQIARKLPLHILFGNQALEESEGGF